MSGEKRSDRRFRLGRVELVLGLALLAVLAVRYAPEFRARTGLPMRAPDLEFETLAGDTVRLAELRGSVVVVNFWATWCAPCRTEMPVLDRVQEAYEGQGLEVVGLSVDTGPISDFVGRLRRGGIDYPLAFASPRARRALGYGGTVPTTVFIDRQGRIAGYVTGAVDEPELRRRLAGLLADGS